MFDLDKELSISNALPSNIKKVSYMAAINFTACCKTEVVGVLFIATPEVW